jgi:hypothetical protein
VQTRAIVAWIEAARAAGNPIPEPSQPALDSIYSGKILVRMPRSLHAQLAQGAKTEAVSLNQHIVFLLTWATTHRTLTTDWTIAVQASAHGIHSPDQSSIQMVAWNTGKVGSSTVTQSGDTRYVIPAQRALALSDQALTWQDLELFSVSRTA